jgi:hypothetical protein
MVLVCGSVISSKEDVSGIENLPKELLQHVESIECRSFLGAVLLRHLADPLVSHPLNRGYFNSKMGCPRKLKICLKRGYSIEDQWYTIHSCMLCMSEV